MGKIEVAVCDTEDGYRDRFVAYLMGHKPGELAVHVFTSPEPFLARLMARSFDAVLLGRGFGEAEHDVEALGIPMLLLTDTAPSLVAEAPGGLDEDPRKKMSMFRYQSAGLILHELKALAGAQLPEHIRAEQSLGGMEVIGVCSPVRHEMQMPFSMVCASWFAERRKVLYVNLMRHSGFLELFGLAGEYGLGDVVLRLRNQRLSPEAFLQCVYETEGVHYIPPFANPESLHELTLGDFGAFLSFLGEKTDFGVAVVDFGEGLDDFAGMLGWCTSIYCPVKSGYFFECQVNQFQSWLEKEEDGQLKERLHMVELPFSAKRIRAGTGVLRQLLWSEFGDYVRGFLSGEGQRAAE